VQKCWHPTIDGLVFAPVVAQENGLTIFGLLHRSDHGIRICPRGHRVVNWWVSIIVEHLESSSWQSHSFQIGLGHGTPLLAANAA
jgi:hypothetical protein